MCIPHKLRVRASVSVISRVFRARTGKTHSFTFFDGVGDRGDINNRTQVLPCSQVTIRPKYEIKLLCKGIVEIYAGSQKLCRVFVPLKDSAEAAEVVVRGAILSVCEAQVEASKLRKEILERRARDCLDKMDRVSGCFEYWMVGAPHRISHDVSWGSPQHLARGRGVGTEWRLTGDGSPFMFLTLWS